MKKNYKRRYRPIFILSITILFTSIFFYFQLKEGDTLQPKNGVLDLAEWKSDGEPLFALGGEWEFYWEKLLYSQDFSTGEKAVNLVKVPNVWNKYELLEEKIEGFGYATYRIHVTGAVIGEKLGLRISPMSTAYRLYIDGTLAASSGKVGISKKTSSPAYSVHVYTFMPETESFDIILQISNYTYERGGFWNTLQFGTAESIESLDRIILFIDIFLLGCFFIMLVYTIVLQFLRIKEKSYLYFIVILLTAMGRVIIYGNYTITYFPVISGLDVIVRIDYLSVIWFVAAILLLTNCQFPGIISKRIIKYSIWFSMIFSCFIILLPLTVVTCLTGILQGWAILLGGYILGIVLLEAFRGRINAALPLVGGSVAIVCGIHDILFENNYISKSIIDYTPLGLFIFLICESIVIAMKYSAALLENEKNLLEIKAVREKEHENEMKFLKSQIKPHFIHNALNAVIAISRKDPEKSRKLLVEFSHFLRSCFDFNNLEDFVILEKEIQLVNSYINIEKARFGESFEVEFIIDDEIDSYQVMIPPLILQPLVENAVTHGIRNKKDGGKIIIYCSKKEEHLYIGVTDNGDGFGRSQKDEMLYKDRSTQGVGLFNINQRLYKLFGTGLVIEDVIPNGADVYMKIPIGPEKRE